MRIATCLILASVIETMTMMRVIAPQPIIEKKAPGKQSGLILGEQSSLDPGRQNNTIVTMISF